MDRLFEKARENVGVLLLVLVLLVVYIMYTHFYCKTTVVTKSADTKDDIDKLINSINSKQN